MAIVKQPDFIPSVFAANGDANTIPATNDGTAGLASFALGFPPITEQPLAQGGLPPRRGDFNGIFRVITGFLQYIQNGGTFGYSENLDYFTTSLISFSDNLYICIKPNGPGTGDGVHGPDESAYWKQVGSKNEIQELLGDYLPLSGGTMTGGINWNQNGGSGYIGSFLVNQTKEMGLLLAGKSFPDDGEQNFGKIIIENGNSAISAGAVVLGGAKGDGNYSFLGVRGNQIDYAGVPIPTVNSFLTNPIGFYFTLNLGATRIIINGGVGIEVTMGNRFTYPLAFNTRTLAIVCSDVDGFEVVGAKNYDNQGFYIQITAPKVSSSYLAIGC